MHPLFVRSIIELYMRHIQREQFKEKARNVVVHAVEVLKSFRVKVDIGPTSAYLKDVQRKISYAKAIALTKTAERLRIMAERRVVDVFDRPTPFVQKGFYIRPASVAVPEATIGIKDRQAKVLLPHIVGGRRERKPFEQRLAMNSAKADGYWVPGAGIKLNQAGNLSRAQIKQIVAGLSKTGRYGEVFVGVPRGVPGAPYGIWSRPTKKSRKQSSLVPLLLRIDQPNYRKRFDFQELVETNAQRIFAEEFNRAFKS